MAKENVGMFYEKLTIDISVAEKLNERDKDFAETNDAPADDAEEQIIRAFMEKAAAAIVLPLAEEVGLPFTIEELKEYEQEQLKEMPISENELDQVAGGRRTKRGDDPGVGLSNCAYIGVGLDAGKVTDKRVRIQLMVL